MDEARLLFESPDVIKDLAYRDYLYKPERIILDILKKKLPKMSMLEIGVGGGRLTKYFASLVKQYVGIDYSSKMIDICKHKFPNLMFFLFDARRDLYYLLDDSYDFTLFGFNGIDHMMYEDRVNVLKNIFVMTNKVFCFSTHIKHFKVKKYDVVDEPYHAEMKALYISPIYQYEMLKEIGYNNIRVFDLSGKEITNSMDKTKDSWIYYLCNIKSKKRSEKWKKKISLSCQRN